MTISDLVPYAVVLGVLVNIIAVVAGVWKGLGGIWNAVHVLVEVRDDFRAMAGKIGTKVPREGLLGDVEEIKDKQYEFGEKLDVQEIKLAVIEANVAQRRTSDKK